MTTMTPWTEDELRAKIGQLFIVGFHGHVPSDDIKTLIQKHKVGAIVLFQRNVGSASQLRELTQSLQNIAKAAGHDQPLFIAIDQENGLVTRIKAPTAAQMPGSMALGATGDPSNAFEVAFATAEVLRSCGINMNYAPVADVKSEPKNPVIGVRSPSDNPDTVGRFVSAQIKGFREGGIIPCVKHFPGHGDTAVDSHFGLPIISKTQADLEDCELVPFQRAVAEGVEAVMTAHIAMPNIPMSIQNETERTYPASLKPDIITILRDRMKFSGMIISDCLEMDGVRATYGTEEGAVMALKAGTDAVMVCHTMSAQQGAIEHVVQAFKKGEVSQERIEISVNRIKRLKQLYLCLVDEVTSPPKEVSAEKQIVLSSKIYAKSVTVVRCREGMFPLPKDTSFKIVFMSPGKEVVRGSAVDSGEEKPQETYDPDTYVDILKVHNKSTIGIRYFEFTPFSAVSQKTIDEANVVILTTRNTSQYPYQKHIALQLAKTAKMLVVIATCDPYDFLEEVEEIRNYITTYEPTDSAFKAAVDVMFGLHQAEGVLPVATLPKPHNIRKLTSSEQDMSLMCDLWKEIFPDWPISSERLISLVGKIDNGLHHFIHEHGFCLSNINIDKRKGDIVCIGVRPAHQGKGIGTSLMKATRNEMRSTLKLASNTSSDTLLGIGVQSSFPRFWSGVPSSFALKDRDFFLHRGFRKSADPICRDLYRDITKDLAPPEVMARVAKLPLTFSSWNESLYEETIRKQRENFGHNKAWVNAYVQLAAANRYEDVLVVFDETGAQVGWTLMCSPSSPMCDYFAFIPLLPSKEKTGLIACVGIDKSTRKGGIGQAMIVAALQDLRKRGAEGIFIDSVVIERFYESLGFADHWKYEKYEW